MITNNLENKLVEMLDKMMEGVGQGVDFMSAQLPDYLEQLLTWFMVYNLTLFVAGLVLPFAVYKLSKLTVYEIFKDDEHVKPPEAFSIVILITVTTIVVSAISLINLEWLQILIAPKVWLVEYILQLKGG